jgi:hypothetical protein
MHIRSLTIPSLTDCQMTMHRHSYYFLDCVSSSECSTVRYKTVQYKTVYMILLLPCYEGCPALSVIEDWWGANIVLLFPNPNSNGKDDLTKARACICTKLRECCEICDNYDLGHYDWPLQMQELLPRLSVQYSSTVVIGFRVSLLCVCCWNSSRLCEWYLEVHCCNDNRTYIVPTPTYTALLEEFSILPRFALTYYCCRLL